MYLCGDTTATPTTCAGENFPAHPDLMSVTRRLRTSWAVKMKEHPRTEPQQDS